MSIGSITTYDFCAVKDGKAFTGSKQDIVCQVCKYWFKDRTLWAEFKGFPAREFCSYTEGYSIEEMYDDAVKLLFSKLTDYGYAIYRNIGF